MLSRDEDSGDQEIAAEGWIADERNAGTAGRETSAIYASSRNGEKV